MRTLLTISFILLIISCGQQQKKEVTSKEPVTTTVTLQVNGMTCDHCEMAIQKSVGAIEGVDKVIANHEDSTVTVKYDSNNIKLSQLSEAIQKKGFTYVGEKK
ncbi:copper chaperone [Puteibacter caeruleilacunae]|nr:copper chaperone [Puteibacter caeruleilacunae]